MLLGLLRLPDLQLMGIHACAVSVTVLLQEVGLLFGLRHLFVFGDVEESGTEVLDPLRQITRRPLLVRKHRLDTLLTRTDGVRQNAMDA